MWTSFCEVCGSRKSRYVCSRCGRRVCEQCFDPKTWLCKMCAQAKGWEHVEPRAPQLDLVTKLFALSFLLIFAGFALIFLSALLTIPSGETSFGFVFFIGPIPIAFGGGPHGLELVAVGVAIAIAVILAMFLILRKWF